MRSRSGENRQRRLVLVGGLLLLAGCATAAGYVLGGLAVPAELERPLPVERSDVRVEDFSDPHTVVIDVSLQSGVKVIVQSNGILTSSSCGSETPIATGGSSFAVDGTPLINLATAHPMWRTLDMDAKGADVRELQRSFANLGFRGATDGVVGPETIAFFNTLRRTFVADAPLVTEIAPSDVVWLGEEPVTGASCVVPVGSVLHAGDAVAELPPRISGLRLGNLPVVMPDLPRTVVIDGIAATVDERGDLDRQSWPEISKTPSFEAYVADPKTVVLKGDVELTTPIQVSRIAPSAIFGTRAGSGCVSDGTHTYEGEIVSSELGYTLMRFESARPSEVLLAPGAELACP